MTEKFVTTKFKTVVELANFINNYNDGSNQYSPFDPQSQLSVHLFSVPGSDGTTNLSATAKVGLDNDLPNDYTLIFTTEHPNHTVQTQRELDPFWCGELNLSGMDLIEIDDGPLQDAYRQMLKSPNNRDLITFTGFVNETAFALASYGIPVTYQQALQLAQCASEHEPSTIEQALRTTAKNFANIISEAEG